MNIFILDYDIKKNVRYHCNSHVNKMSTEYTQMLSSVFYYTDEMPKGIYKLTHKNNSCTKWVRESLSNWKYLRKLALACCKEYEYRYGREHKCYSIIRSMPLPHIDDIGLTPFVQAIPKYCKRSDAVEAYRFYYNNEKRHLFKWKYRPVPEWVTYFHLIDRRC